MAVFQSTSFSIIFVKVPYLQYLDQMKKFTITLFMLLFATSAFSQKKNLDHSVYDSWKSVRFISMSDDGQVIAYTVREQEGDGYVDILNTNTLEKKPVHRAERSVLTPDGKYLIAAIKPFFAETKEAQRKKLKQDQMPKDTLGIYNYHTGELVKYPFLESFKKGLYGNKYIAYQTDMPADTTEGKKPVKKDKKTGSDLMVYHLRSGITDTLKAVTHYQFSVGGDSLFLVRRPASQDSLLEAGLFMYTPEDKKLTTIYTSAPKQTVKLPVISQDNKHMAFLVKPDSTTTGNDSVSIFYYREGLHRAELLLKNEQLQEGWQISNNREPAFSQSGHRIFFGIAPIRPVKDTTVLDSDVPKLDIWHYKENYIQPQQLVNLRRELNRSFLCVADIGKEPAIRQLAKEEYPTIQIPCQDDADWGYSVSNYNYQLESTWSADPRANLYIINVNDGTSEMLLQDHYISNVAASPEGKYLIWYNNLDSLWYSYNPAKKEIVCITPDLNVSFANELHDTPSMPRSYGYSAWADEDKAVYINDRYDVWQIDPSGQTPPVALTGGLGRREQINFRMAWPDYVVYPPGIRRLEKETIKPGATVYFSAFDEKTKENGYYYMTVARRKSGKNTALKPWIVEPMTFNDLNRSTASGVVCYIKHNFENSPDVWITKDNFKTQEKITDINPQQATYNWGTAELIRWKSAIGQDLEGILYKPENFDPARKYPMLVYFYERNSHTLYTYRSPAPSRSTINIPFFVSNEYLVFVPDIIYREGHPGQSAMDCIVPGVEKLIEDHDWIDAENIGIQGQSWGGYQVAFMVTRPEVFKWKAAGAGAPVANMTSAYGGIRWGSGMVRQFQYEDTQSRIGATLWDNLDLYIENSPLFFVHKVETPVLIMHNDKDDAVPWYQGIEYFTALRRLGKPSWLLQYNDEVHNLSKRTNAKDLSIRLEQFFNHYLKGAPMPVWMKSGVPATLKGIDLGYDLTEE